MAIADANGTALRPWLLSAECFNDNAILRGSIPMNTPGSRSNAWLVSVICCVINVESCLAALGLYFDMNQIVAFSIKIFFKVTYIRNKQSFIHCPHLSKCYICLSITFSTKVRLLLPCVIVSNNGIPANDKSSFQIISISL